MKVLFAASEAVPFVKTGGLADVIGTLPAALKNLNIEPAIILPCYSDIPEAYKQEMELVGEFTVPLGWREQPTLLYGIFNQQVPCYFVQNEYYFDRPGIYGHEDEAERFAYFSRAVVETLPYLHTYPDIIHCHDWHTGLIPVYLEDLYRQGGANSSTASVFTIHNLNYQGIFPREVLEEVLGLGQEHFTMNGLEFHGQVNFLKGGIAYSDLVTTVSPTYAKEIQQSTFGEGLDGFLRQNQDKIYGVLNGIDYQTYDPATDPHLNKNYDANSLNKKRENKKHLQERLGLPISDKIPVIGVVSRLVAQKGMELIARVIHDILAKEVQMAVLGSGESSYEHLFIHMEKKHPHKIKANIKYDEELARQIYAGADFLLIPSLFEPCGLNQMISLRYGTVPIVRETGGLKDTVEPYNEFTGEGNGFSFANYNAHDMLHTLENALLFYYKKPRFNRLVRRGMKMDFSWSQSARKYKDLYSLIV